MLTKAFLISCTQGMKTHAFGHNYLNFEPQFSLCLNAHVKFTINHAHCKARIRVRSPGEKEKLVRTYVVL